MQLVERVQRILADLGTPYGLIGARAVSLRGHPRLTIDYDFLTVDRRILQATLWAGLAAAGASVEVRKGDWDDPLPGVVRIRQGNLDVDVLLAKRKWEQAVLERAESMDLGGFSVPVPLTSDLILLKLNAGGIIDVQDVAALLEAGDREALVDAVDSRIDELDPDPRQLWQKIRTAAP